ncbi:MAG TPA: SH3 domain-containing protein [Beijerinckiaceae bacterium]|nr:SH3 domain-containing protein [Beijerinckiaceae bacterium]
MRNVRLSRLLCLLGLIASPVMASGTDNTGTVTGLPIPRFVSLKPSDTPMREGPSKDHRIKWVFKREGLPVEIMAEFDTWRRVRDSEGTEGWVFHSRLSSRRTALVAPWSKEKTLPLYEREGEGNAVVARLQPGVLANIESCNGRWCRVNGEGFRGWMKQDFMWGVYPGEAVR